MISLFFWKNYFLVLDKKGHYVKNGCLLMCLINEFHMQFSAQLN
jgi:hypothetical protein